ncbi:hypothetical protein L483_21825 [Pseudomonas putida H8234]|nr:hypothetical protein L483_21825 [Pseudomonas putida H8234]
MLSFPVLPNQGNQPFSLDDNAIEPLESDIIFTIRDIGWQSDSNSHANGGSGDKWGIQVIECTALVQERLCQALHAPTRRKPAEIGPLSEM